jgi:hypothetical protein
MPGTFPYSKPRRFLRATLAGLAAPNREGGFVGAFKAGLGGSLGFGQEEAAAAAEAEKERLRQDLEERLFGLNERRTAADEARAAADTAREARQALTTQENDFLGVMPPGTMGPLAPGEVYAPEGLPVGGYKTYAEGLGREKAQPGGGAAPTSRALQDNIKYFMANGYSFEDAVALVQRLTPTISTGTIYDALRGVTLPTTTTRTPQIPVRNRPAAGPLGTIPSHKPALEDPLGLR